MQSNRKYAQVLYDFNGRSDYDDEFSVKKGDVLQILFEINNDWLCVRSLMKFKLLNDKKFSGGIVPKDYLKQFEISDNQLNQQLYLAIDDFGLEDNNSNFYFYKNDLLIAEKNNNDANFLYGNLFFDELDNTVGKFPTTFVQEINLPNVTNRETRKARALNSFKSIESSFVYLNFEKDDYLFITNELDDSNWFIGEKLNGDKGLIHSKNFKLINKQTSKSDIKKIRKRLKSASLTRNSSVENKNSNKRFNRTISLEITNDTNKLITKTQIIIIKYELDRLFFNHPFNLLHVPSRIGNKNRNRPSSEFLQNRISSSQSIDEFWPIIEENTFHDDNNEKSFDAHMPLATKYTKSHLFEKKTILDWETCNHCAKRTKFGKIAMKCAECALVVHTDCKEKIQIPCYSALNFPIKGKINEYCLNNESPSIPPFLRIVIYEIEQKGLITNVVGLYRENGSLLQKDELKNSLIKRRKLPDFRKIKSVHTLCSFVKDFLNTVLTEHLVTNNLWSDFKESSEIQIDVDRILSFKNLLQKLPESNRDTLAFLILHLQRISKNNECKMSVSNLAIAFGPVLVGNSSNNLTINHQLKETLIQHKIVENLIELPAAFYMSILDREKCISNKNEEESILNQIPSLFNFLTFSKNINS